ncbi:hypothetical protein M407DRAFT_95657 [Tulasnella calospora MUT 4182]|uniref:Uncharacterized protein n=1 Tax=Tulasnella calospora MUT 4182 TaxID=1051891 RepID=A0A0C3LFP6_9AGAM|nr:hypothetical protein M407DRAFT_95657 [Tulasnella calospora MUT 4182]
MPQAPPYITPQPNTLMNTQPYSLPSQALTTNPGYNSTAPLDPSSASDQAAWQSLLNSPTGMQMFLNAMSQPNAFPTIPPMPTSIPGVDAMNGQTGGLDYAANPYGIGSSNVGGQLIQSTPNPFAGLVPPAQYPAYDMSGQGPMGGLPDNNMLSLFGNNTGLMPLDALGAHSAQLAQTGDKHKVIDARVDALGQSLNALLGHINLDPATMLPLDHNDAVDSSQHLAQTNQPMDLSSMLQSTVPDASAGPITGADFDVFDAHPQAGQTNQANGEFLDEMGSASTASSPNLDVKDIQSTNKGSSPPVRKSKRKSDAMEVDSTVPQAMRPIKSKKPTRKK